MNVNQLAIELLNQLKDIAIALSDNDYYKPIEILGGSSIAAHNRHSLEFFQMLILGIKSGIICYDKRIHNKDLETIPKYFLSEVDRIIDELKNIKVDSKIDLEVKYPLNDINEITQTTISREIVYNIEHLVHHMAIIKIGFKQEFPFINLPENFGIAQSTVVFQKSEVKA